MKGFKPQAGSRYEQGDVNISDMVPKYQTLVIWTNEKNLSKNVNAIWLCEIIHAQPDGLREW